MSTRKVDGRAFILGDSIAAILSEAGIQLGRARLVPGRNTKVQCPACGARDEDSLSVKLDDDGQGATWHCFRGSCPGSATVPGNGRIESAERRGAPPPGRRERPPVQAPVLDDEILQVRHEGLLAMFAGRGISEETVAAFGVYGKPDRWPKLENGKPVKGEDGKPVWVPKGTIVFPYRWRGAVVNRKFRSSEKQFKQDKDALRTLFNADAIELDENGATDEVIICEGEFDVMACWEAGFRQVVSIPDGSPNKELPEDDPKRLDDQRYDCLETCGEKLAKAKRIIIATDGDVAGGYLAEELARRLGRVRCLRVTWPEGTKDANDVLQKLGAEALQDAVADARPLPLEGIFDMRPGVLHEFLHAGKEPKGLKCGIGDLDEVMSLPDGSGWLTVVTGVPSHGKSTFLRTWLVRQSARNDIGIVWASPEDNRPENLGLRITSTLVDSPTKAAGSYMHRDDLKRGEDWIRDHVQFLWSDNPDMEMTLDWVLARALEAKQRLPKMKRFLLVLDPWNEFEHQYERNQSETQYTGRWLRKLKAWGRANGFSVLIAAHPPKLQKDPKTKLYPVADGYDISGGSNWFNKADMGMTVYRRDEGYPEAHCWKARYDAFGLRHKHARLKLNPRTGSLHSTSNEAGEMLEEAEN